MNDIEIEDIKLSLNYYDIDDKEYFDRCLRCIDYIKNNNLMDDILRLVDKLYNDDMSDMWKIKKVNEIIQCEDMWITNIMLLVGYKLHEIHMKEYHFDEEQIIIHKARVKECLTSDIYNRGLDGIRFSQLLWGIYFIRIKLIEVGRLQYGLSGDEIHIHIFGGRKLDYDEVVKSIKDSKEYIKKYYGVDNPDYRCNSWLLSKEVRNLISDESNIAKFQSLFDIEQGEECEGDILNFVFKVSEVDDYHELKEDANLQKLIKEELIKGTKFYLGCGKLKQMPVD